MFAIKRQSRMDKMKAALLEAVSYADEMASDNRLRADLRAAMEHGAEARNRIRKGFEEGGISMRLANDSKLRKNVRAMLDDLDSASDRMHRKKRHRLRNGLLVIGSVGAMAAAIPNVRRWVAGRASGASEGAVDVGMAV
jgi:hypothetical protein